MMKPGNPGQELGPVMYGDHRSKRVIFVSHCILNQNAMIDGLAGYAGVVREVVEAIVASGCGIVQMECAEITLLGMDRRVDRHVARTIGSEDSRVRLLREKRSGRAISRRIAEQVCFQINQYLQNGFIVAGVIGVNVSPTCGVETSWLKGAEVNSPGVLIRELQEAFRRHNLAIPIRGLELNDPVASVEVVRKMVGLNNSHNSQGFT